MPIYIKNLRPKFSGKVRMGSLSLAPKWEPLAVTSFLEDSTVDFTVTAVSGEPIAYSVVGSMPQGLAFNPTAHRVTGTVPMVPPSGAVVSFVLRATGVNSGKFSDVEITLSYVNVDHTPVWATPAALPDTLESVSVDVTLAATSDKPITYSYVSGNLPAGFSLNAVTGKLTGIAPAVTPSGVTLSFVARASNAYGETADRTFTLKVVNVNQNPTWTTASDLGSREGGLSYNQALLASDSDGNIASYSLVGGALPTGVTLNSTSGVLSGTLPSVTSSTTYTFTVRATDNDAGFTDRSFALTVTVSPSVYVGRNYTANEAYYTDKPNSMGQVEV